MGGMLVSLGRGEKPDGRLCMYHDHIDICTNTNMLPPPGVNGVWICTTYNTVLYARLRDIPMPALAIPQLRNMDNLDGSCMVETEMEVEGTTRPAYIYRWGPDLEVGRLYHTNRYGGLSVYECVRLLHTAPAFSDLCTESQYLLLALDEAEIVDILGGGRSGLT
jgi:hypothetical protein